MDGKHHDAFPVDMIQGGAGTTTNMNANEVIANRALEIMGHQYGEYQYCSPNDDVNCAQSTNDAYPTAIHLGMYATHLKLVEHLKQLIESFEKKAAEFADVLKMGRTQLEDAVPMTLGQTFHGFASILRDEIVHLNEAAEDFLTINMGATAIGTGICAEPHREHRSDHRLEDPFDGRLGRRYVRYFVPGRLRFRHEACRREDEQNLQRPAPAGFGPPLRSGRVQPAGPSAGIVDHAG